MNPLVELKERLVHITIAGTELLEEDFRLKKTMETFSVLAEKNPIFQKLYLGLKQLFEAEKPQKPIMLLNILGLLDAVLYTQAQTGMEGDYQEIVTSQHLNMPEQYRYSIIKPVLEALSTTGSGRLNVVEDAVKHTPEIFKDYRILNALIQDLDDTYGEMASLVTRILEGLSTGKSLGFYEYDENEYRNSKFRHYPLPKVDSTSLIELLKEQFDPQGKRVMAKRLKLIATIAKETENDWYLSILKTAKKEVREECISALQYCEDNIPTLLELAKKERGKAKDMVYQVLGMMHSGDMTAFWMETLKQNPQYAVYLKEDCSDEISDLLADTLKPSLEQQLLEKEGKETESYLSCTVNKTSDKMLELYRWILEQADSIKKRKWNWLLEIRSTIIETLVSSYPEKLIHFLNTLPEKHKKILGEACFCVDLLTCSSDEVYEKWHDSSVIRKDFDGFKDIWLDEGHYYYVVKRPYEYYWMNQQKDKRELKGSLDERWFDDMIARHADDRLSQLTPKESQELCRKVGAYFHQKLTNLKGSQHMVASEVLECLSMMHYCSYHHYQGVVLSVCEKHPSIYVWHLRVIFYRLREYAGVELVKKEAKAVFDFYQQNYAGKSICLEIQKMLVDEGFVEEEV